jgi:hypothetical protein
MEKQRLANQEAQEARAVETHTANLRSMRIANDANEFKLDQTRKQEDFANESIVSMQGDFEALDQDFNISANALTDRSEEGPGNRKALAKWSAMALQQFEAKYAHLKDHPIHGTEYAQRYAVLQGKLMPLAESRSIDMATEWDQYRGAVAGVMRAGTKEEALDAYTSLDEKFGELESVMPQQYQARRKEALDFITKKFSLDASKKELREADDYNQAKADNLRNIKRAIGKVEKAIVDIDKAFVGNVGERTKGFLSEWWSGKRDIELNLDNITTEAWVEMVSALKGALSDKEGARFAKALPNESTNKKAWAEYLEELLEYLNSKLEGTSPGDGIPNGGGGSGTATPGDALKFLGGESSNPSDTSDTPPLSEHTVF